MLVGEAEQPGGTAPIARLAADRVQCQDEIG
jgi:hypothetical protein